MGSLGAHAGLGSRGGRGAGAEEPDRHHFTIKVLVGKWEFSSMLDAASDLKTTAQPPRCRASAGEQM